MYLLLQRSPDPVPYRGAYFRIAPSDGRLARGSIILPRAAVRSEDAEGLALLIGLAIALGDPPGGGTPIRQHWLREDLRLEGKMGSEISPRHAAEAARVAARVGTDWERFLGSAFARLRGERRGDAHFRFPGGTWDAERPATFVAAWPPLPGEVLPTLEHDDD